MTANQPRTNTVSRTLDQQFEPFAARMRAESLPDLFVRTFRTYYEQLVAGQTGLIPESDIRDVEHLPDAETFSETLSTTGIEALPHSVVIKLNGGLGTSMGLSEPKSLLIVKDGLSFLDITALHARMSGVPLVLMNSFSTRATSLNALMAYPALGGDIPLDFLQHKAPKVRQDNLQPVDWPSDPGKTWNPPGHGDIYTALVTSGLLQRLIDAGYRYAFVSNIDNLGAALDRRILGYFVENQLPFMMEAADRTHADRKGGHLARSADGHLLLREGAQCPPVDSAAFQDITRHRYFNTNNLWLNLRALDDLLAETDGILGLPLIRNSKTVDPRDPDSTPVYQIETAMGSAIAAFEGAGAIRVPRSRFAPVKTTDDLLAVRSDAYVLSEDYRVQINPRRELGQIVVDLDTSYYKLIDDLEARFTEGVPSLLECDHFTVRGDIRFGGNIILKGSVSVENQNSEQITLPASIVLSGRHT